MAAVKALQQWCKIQCDGYRDVAITNMTTSFRDGLAFCALIHKHRPDLIDYDSLSKENVYHNNELAFRVAEEHLGIPALLDADDMVALRVPDRLSILTYVSQYYNYFHGRSPIGGMAGIKRPAENSTEEPSGKKNQPVIAKPFPFKPTPENHPPPTTSVTTPSRPSPKPARAANQKKGLTESSNKTGTLSSTCSVCRNHVHLVQRHLVDGKLYHRNCFKCSECSNILLSGTYKPGPTPGTFICTTHQGTQIGGKTPSSASVQKNGPVTAKLGPTWLVTKNNSSSTPRPTSALSSPAVTNRTPSSPTPAAKSLTPSAQKNQAARQRFFESTPSAQDNPPNNRWSVATPETTGKGRVLLKVEEDKDKAKSVITKKLTEANSNNNNTVYHSGLNRPTDNRYGNKPAEAPSWERDQKSPGLGGLKPVEPSPRVNTATATTGPLWMKTNSKEAPRPQSTFSSNIKDLNSSESPADWRSKLKPVSKGPKTTESKEPSFTIETKKILAPSKPTPSGPAPTQPQKPTGLSISTPPTTLGNQRALSPKPSHNGSESCGFKNGKGSSSTNASQPEVKSPKTKPDYIPKEDILKELKDIENNLNDLEKKGIEMEKQLRLCEQEGAEDTSVDELMVDWFNLIRQKQVYMRRESELVYIAKTQDLEEQQPGVEEELRRLIEKPEHLKTAADKKREEELMEKLVEIVNDRNAIVEGLDEDRLREEEEDQQLNQLMQNLDIKKDKNKKKSNIKKLFGWKSKKEVVED
ncbi:protein-methionine sulfoxide oxidase mical2b isoform X2 [Megalops cyprinoides]|uniref:protein-methionine sulfoxide oxidase mical2b isoform X2 n=1 Tax=Megalops cyprinoides TaxID=118141 RepID=UPI0018647658|nr:protein-methionine sulfoxide oxidase mical2b isoform X2 [Megalops cyprinoides]